MMTDREKRLSLALDALVQAEDTLTFHRDTMPSRAFFNLRLEIRQAKAHIEAAAMPKPSVLRRWFGRLEAA